VLVSYRVKWAVVHLKIVDNNGSSSERNSTTKKWYGLRLVITITVLAICAACAEPDRSSQAQDMVEKFYQTLEQSQYDKAIQFFSEELLTTRSTQQWVDYFTKRAIREAVFKDVETNTVFSGRFYIFDYEVTDTSGTGAETITVFHSLADDTTRIVSYKVYAGLPANEAN